MGRFLESSPRAVASSHSAPLTLAQFYGKHHEAAAAADAREVLDLATRFCRKPRFPGWTPRPTRALTGADPSRFSNRISLELGQGGHAALLQVDPDLSAHPLDAAIHAGVLGHKPLATAYALLPAEQREGLLRAEGIHRPGPVEPFRSEAAPGPPSPA